MKSAKPYKKIKLSTPYYNFLKQLLELKRKGNNVILLKKRTTI